MKRATIVVCLLALAGCAKIDPNQAKRGELRRQYFVECMKLLPPGPQGTQYNDWSEVVESCDSTAMYQANQAMP